MKIIRPNLSGLLVLEPNLFQDERGYFFESFKKTEFLKVGLDIDFVQENESQSDKGVVRGLHLQAPPYGQTKLLRVVRGAIYDVALDIRKNSPTFGQYFGIELNERNKLSFLIPEGFAHGFSCLEDKTIVQYKCSNYYNKESELGVAWNDIELGIDWKVKDAIISNKDMELPSFSDFNSPY